MIRAIQFAYSASERSHFEKRSTFRECAIASSDASGLEAGHELLWLGSSAAVRTLSHPSHGWAVERWIERSVAARERDPIPGLRDE